jgi:hypothetical protein
MKWILILLVPFFLLACPQQELFRIFDISPTATQEEILQTVQRLWIQQGKERWQFDKKFEELRPQLWPLFVEIGMVDAITPECDHYETVLVLGALLSTVQERVDYLIECGVTFDQLVFLSGERPLLESEKLHLSDLKTESQMVRWVYRHSSLPKDIPVLFIEAPMNGLRRPNTLDTICAWLKTSPRPKSCLAISSQPYVHYQGAIFARFVPFPIETVGGALKGTRSVALMLDTLAREWTYKYGDIEWLQL